MKHVCIVFMAFAGLLSSCQESEKAEISRLVKEWEGREIVFPGRSVFTVQGRDTVSFGFSDAPYKVVTYVDSMGCMSCKLQFPRWKELIHEVRDSLRLDVPFLFYLHPKKLKEMTYTLRRDGFEHPVCIDVDDEFNSLNHFPANATFQTFLLDKENKVVAIGNPVHNPKVKALYLRLLKGEKEDTSAGEARTAARLSTGELDFGKFPRSEKQERTVLLKNIGKAPLVIHDVTTSCGCTRVEYERRPAAPGKELRVKVIYEADESGHFHKTVELYCNTADSPIRLSLTGESVDDK